MNDDDRYIRITLRIPKELHQRLSVAADETSKSLNAEIVGRLSESFNESEPVAKIIKMAEVEALERRLERSAKEAHMQVLQIGLDGQVRDVSYRLARQKAVVEKLRERIDAAESSGDTKTARHLESELHAEEKWCFELEMEWARLKDDFNRLSHDLALIKSVGAH